MLTMLMAGIGLAADLEAEIILDAPQLRVGEPTYFTFRVHNHGSETIWREVGGDYRNALGRADSFRCTLTDSGGAARPVPDAGYNMGGRVYTAPIPPGEYHDQLLYLPNWGQAEAAGVHTLACSVTLQFSDREGFDAPRSPLPVTARITLDVLAADHAEMGALIASLAAQASGEDRYHVIRMLGSIDDPRVIPHLAEQARSPDPQQAIRALTKFNDDAALDAILSALQITGDDIQNVTTRALGEQVAANHRLAAAQALSESVHPGAHGALLSLADHPDDNIRLTVVHALGRDPGASATEMLEGFQADPYPLVAKEARRYLSER